MGGWTKRPMNEVSAHVWNQAARMPEDVLVLVFFVWVCWATPLTSLCCKPIKGSQNLSLVFGWPNDYVLVFGVDMANLQTLAWHFCSSCESLPSIHENICFLDLVCRQ